MKKSVALRLCLLVLTVALIGGVWIGRSLGFEAPAEEASGAPYVVGVDVLNGEMVVTYSDGSQQNLGPISTTIINNEYIVQGGSGTDSAAAASRGLLSTLEVYCGFGTAGYQLGAGVIYQLNKTTGDAFIITNFHIVYNEEYGISEEILLLLCGDVEMITAEYVGGSAQYDVAVLSVKGSERLKTSSAQAVTVANSDTVVPGQPVLAIGNPGGDGTSVTMGVVSMDSEYITMLRADNGQTVELRSIRVDAAVNLGNSGGGLYDMQGRLLGVVNARSADTQTENTGYVIPTNVAVGVAQNIIDHCYGTDRTCVRRALMGVAVTYSESSLVYDSTTGLAYIRQNVVVNSVNDGIGKDAGVQAGDIITAIRVGDRAPVTLTRYHQVIDEMMWARVGDTVTLTLLRNGTPLTVTLTVTEGCVVDA